MSIAILLPFGLLGLAVLSVWLIPPSLARYCRLPSWLVLLIAAALSAYYYAWVDALGLLWLACLLGSGWVAQAAQLGRAWRIGGTVLSGVLALLLGLHWLPGFHNPIFIASVTLSEQAPAFTQYASFDKAAAGVMLLALFCRRTHSWAEAATVIGRAVPLMLVTTSVVLLAALALEYLRLDLKWPTVTPYFLIYNLLFTCVVEEAFFRGLIQEQLAQAFSRYRSAQALTVGASALLFGLAYFASGWMLMMLAGLAGLGYAYAYARLQRIEAPILLHFGLNAVHWLGFTYPHLL